MGIKKSTMENMGRLNFWKGKNVLVTGGSGLVGSHIVEELLKNKANVVTIIRSKNPNSYFFTEGLDKSTVIAIGDLKDYKRAYDIISKYEIEYIFHVGAQAIVPTGLKNPVETFETNINGTVNVLEAARLCNGVKSIVVASSDKAYGTSDKLPYTEDMPLEGDFPYDVSKSCTDLIAQSYFKTYKMPITIARFGNIYGPGDLNFDRIIPGTIYAALLKETLKIRSDGKMIREYLYVKDVAEGYLMLCENINKSKGEAFNLSSGLKLSVLEVVKKISKIMYPIILLFDKETSFFLKILKIKKEKEQAIKEGELESILKQSEMKVDILPREKKMIENVLLFNDIAVAEPMIPITHVEILNINSEENKISEILTNAKNDFIIVYDNCNILAGILSVHEGLKCLIKIRNSSDSQKSLRTSLKEILIAPYFVEKDKKIWSVFKEMKVKRLKIAIVIDENKKIKGIIKMEDMFEEIVGDV